MAALGLWIVSTVIHNLPLGTAPGWTLMGKMGCNANHGNRLPGAALRLTRRVRRSAVCVDLFAQRRGGEFRRSGRSVRCALHRVRLARPDRRSGLRGLAVQGVLVVIRAAQAVSRRAWLPMRSLR